jgi:hypothetical protein
MRRLAVLVTVIGLLASAAAAVTVTLPLKTRAKATVVVDELGQVLFGSAPGKVEVTNMPSVTVAPEEIFNASFDRWTTPANGPQVIATVPANRVLVLTDVVWAANNVPCYFDISGGSCSGSASGPCRLTDSSGGRLVLDTTPTGRQAYTTGLRFGPWGVCHAR